ncbi:histidine phosphatase family protein [Umboniibacter marinipuniceus]|uniref:Broad specificity phosphatase PhoE n=1 Tax=Umboniibacter marinipuniceus TaxID=569599 RepID=A0A3M0A3W9_9GAMM|nr:phosphoglycerate mutase family protein [Umboniibacter marinipuniceus]RMA79470.1 broad specificity phosphatase PhoE [Umboniibacter marinipuniceus]
MPKLYIVRHGHPESGWSQDPDPGLSEVGQAQAAEAAKVLANYAYQQVVSSPMARAIQTARVSASELDIQTEQAIREIPSYWVPSSQRQSWLDNTLRSTWDSVEPEIKVWRESLTNWATSLEKDTLAFSHFVVINALIATATGAENVVNALPDHCAIAEFEIIDGQLHFLSIDKELDSSVMV